jgi:hypothetical protein
MSFHRGILERAKRIYMVLSLQAECRRRRVEHHVHATSIYAFFQASY